MESFPVSDDPRSDFFSSQVATPASTDARSDFFSNGTIPDNTPPESGDRVVKDLIHAKVSKGIASIGGGFRAIGDLATGSSAAQADTRYKQFVTDHAWTPSDPTSQALVNVNQQADTSALNPTTWVGRALDKGSNVINQATGSTVAGPVAMGLLQGALPFVGMRSGAGAVSSPFDAQVALSRMGSKQSMGSAASTPNIASMSPELQQAVRAAAQKTGGAIPPETLTRHVEADSLPVKLQLTEGQATQDPDLISSEMNTRGRTPDMVKRLSDQNSQLTQNVQAIRDRVGPDVFSTNPVEHGDTLIKAYKDKDETASSVIRSNYKALKDANGGDFPVDGQMFVNNADRALKTEMKRPFVPGGVNSIMQEFRDGEPMTFENFENLRTTLAAESRKAERSGDGNAAAAVNLVREHLEALPMPKAAEGVKQLADTARSSAKARFDALRADPAYKAAVSDSVAPDQFVRKFITGPSATRDGVAQMRENLKDNDTAAQTMGVATLDHLRDSAGVGPGGTGNFSQAMFNRHLQALSPKLNSLVDPATSEQLDTLGRVARYTQVQPRGSSVNNSNTAVALLAEHAKSGAEGAVNYAFHGLPVGTVGAKILSNRAAAKGAKKSLEPGAGLTRMPKVGKP